MDAEKFSEYFDDAPVYYGTHKFSVTEPAGSSPVHSPWPSVSSRYPLHTPARSQLPARCHHDCVPDPYDATKG